MGSRRDGIDRLDCQGQNKAFLSFSGSEQIDSKKQREREERKGEISFARTSRPCMGQLCGSVADKANSRCASFVSVIPGKKKRRNFEIVILVAHWRIYFRVFWSIFGVLLFSPKQGVQG